MPVLRNYKQLESVCEPAKPGSQQRDGSNASIVEALKETDRHMEELYRQAGEGRVVSDGLNAARERARALTDAIIKAQHLNDQAHPTAAGGTGGAQKGL